jgi:pimeloyl-ACP methyl ester carboxylesterase
MPLSNYLLQTAVGLTVFYGWGFGLWNRVGPLLVLGGLWDPRAPRPALRAWERHAAGPCRVVMFPGDHFYHRSAPAPVLRVLREELTRRLG